MNQTSGGRGGIREVVGSSGRRGAREEAGEVKI